MLYWIISVGTVLLLVVFVLQGWTKKRHEHLAHFRAFEDSVQREVQRTERFALITSPSEKVGSSYARLVKRHPVFVEKIEVYASKLFGSTKQLKETRAEMANDYRIIKSFNSEVSSLSDEFSMDSLRQELEAAVNIARGMGKCDEVEDEKRIEAIVETALKLADVDDEVLNGSLLHRRAIARQAPRHILAG